MPDTDGDKSRSQGSRVPHENLVAAARARVDAASDRTTPSATGESQKPGQHTRTNAVPKLNASAATLGRFDLLERLGQGGFATVWKAMDPHLDRLVAVKIPRDAELTATEAELFLREARAASQVRHPHVVRLHEVGRDGEALYLVSDLIEGLPLDAWAAEQTLPPRQVAELCRTIAEALSAIHRAGVVHRDLKPSNILIDQDGQPHITDFGLAKRREAEATLTLEGQMMGTPAYMSPEQARGESRAVDEASDLYSLGVIMFELLTGELPFRGRPHVILSQTVYDDPPSLRTLNPHIPPDLETICLRCLEKEPAHRYAVADEIADEFERYLRGEPILSRPIGLVRRAIRWCRRHPVNAALLAVLSLVAVLGPILTLRFRALAQQAMTAQAKAETSEREKSELLYVSQINSVQQAAEQGDLLRAKDLLEAQIPQEGQSDLRDFEWYYWNARFKQGLVWELGPFGQLESVAVSPDGKWLAWGGETGIVTFRNLETEESFALPALNASEDNPPKIYCLAFSPTEDLLAIGRDNREVSIFSITQRKELFSLPTEGQSIRAIAFSDDAKTLAAGTGSGTLELWSDLQIDSRRVIEVTEHSLRSLDFSSDGESIVVVINSYRTFVGGLACLEVATGETLTTWESSDDYRAGLVAKFSVDDHQILFDQDLSFSIQRLNTETLANEGVVSYASRSTTSALAMTQDGRQLIAGGTRGELVAWDLNTGEVTAVWPGHQDYLMAIAILPDEKQMVTCSFDGYVRCWQMGTGHAKPRILQTPGQVFYASFSPDSRRLYVTGNQRGDHLAVISAWSIPSGEPIWQHQYPGDTGGHVAISPDGATLVTTHSSGTVRFLDAKSGRLLEKIVAHQPNRRVLYAAFSTDGRYLATAEGWHMNPPFDEELTEHIFVWDFEQRKILHRWPAHGRKAAQLLFGPQEDELISYGWDKRIRRWRISSQELLAEFETGDRVVRGMQFANDGQTLVAVDSDGVISRWDLVSGTQLETINQRDGYANSTSLSPAGYTLAMPLAPRSKVTNGDSLVRLIDTRTWEPKTDLAIEGAALNSAAFSPNGEYLAAGDYLGRVYLWSAPREAEESE